MLCPMSVFATDVSGGEMCDTDVLNTDTGPVNLRAEFEPETINLKWYNGDTHLTVPNASNTCTYDDAISLPTNPTKPGYKFNGWKAIPGTRVEYLQSSGRQYIDTGIVPSATTNFDVGYMYIGGVGHTNAGQVILGVRNDNGGVSKGFLISSFRYNNNNVVNADSSLNNGYVRLGDDGVGTYYLPQQNNTYVSLKSDTTGYIYFNGVKLSETPLTRIPYGVNFSIYLFRLHHESIADYAVARIYYLKLYNDTTLVRDMVPIKDTNGVPCMYDFVSKQKFYNAGTGDFITGPDL